MRTDLHQSELLFAGVVVSGGSLVLLCVVGALLVGVLVGWMNQLPRVLRGGVTKVFINLNKKYKILLEHPSVRHK